jgi:hypothetical protein
MADESVVVSNPLPEKAGNRLEEKIKEILCNLSQKDMKEAKSVHICEGRKFTRNLS